MKMQKLMGALILILMLGATPVTAQNMSDSQVLEYVKEGIRQGKELLHTQGLLLGYTLAG